MEQEKCSKIAHKLDLMPRDERKFALWYLLREYYENDLEIPENPATIEQYREMIFTRDIRVAMNHLIEILGFDLWG